MKRALATLFLGMCAAAMFTGCSMVSPLNGSIYTDIKAPVTMGTGTASSKVGEATATSILGFAFGDATIETAMKNGGITKVHHIDTRAKNILGVYAEITTIVHGE